MRDNAGSMRGENLFVANLIGINMVECAAIHINTLLLYSRYTYLQESPAVVLKRFGIILNKAGIQNF